MRAEHETQEKKIIWQAHFLSREYLPKKVIGREEQRGTIEMCLSPMKDGQAPLNVWLYGPAGTGKTVLARTVVMGACGSSLARFGFYVNCWERHSLYSVVLAIADSLRLLRADAQDTNVKLNRIRQVIKERPMVVILDDIDKMPPTERARIIYTLLDLPRCGVVCISNQKETLLKLEERARSRLTPMVIPFPQYRRQELKKILLERAKDSLVLDGWSEAVLMRLARCAGGDACAAIQGLRQAAVAAENSRINKLTASMLPDALPGSAETRREEMVCNLSYHERLIYKLALEKEPILTTDLRRVYDNHCQNNSVTPVARRTFSKYVRLMGDRRLVAIDKRSTGGKGRLLRAPAT